MNPALAAQVQAQQDADIQTIQQVHKADKVVSNIDLLDPFIGKWHVTGKNLAGATLGTNSDVEGDVIYDHLPGKHFVVCRWSRRFKEGDYIGIGVMGPDALTTEFVTHNYDNMGFERRYQIVNDGKTWMFTGERERGKIVFSMDGKSFSEDWEIADEDGINWNPLCTLKAVHQ